MLPPKARSPSAWVNLCCEIPRGHTQGCHSGFPNCFSSLKPKTKLLAASQEPEKERKDPKNGAEPGPRYLPGVPVCGRGDLAAARISSLYFYDDTFHPRKAIPPPRQPSAPSGKGNAVPAPGPGAWLWSWSRFPITSCVVSPPRSELTQPCSSHGNCHPRGSL